MAIVILNGKPIEVSDREYQVLLRNEFYLFIERSFYELSPETCFYSNWHIEVIAQALEDCRVGTTRRLIINVPPRSLKSHCASIALPAWILGHNPGCPNHLRLLRPGPCQYACQQLSNAHVGCLVSKSLPNQAGDEETARQ